MLLKFVDERAEEVLVAPGFGKLPEELVIKIVERETLDAEEIVLFEAVVAWGKAQAAEEKKEVTPDYLKTRLKALLPLIRFPCMSSEQIAIKVAPTEVLEGGKLLALYTHFARVPDGKGRPSEAMADMIDRPRKRGDRASRRLTSGAYENWAQAGYSFDITAKRPVTILGLAAMSRNAGTWGFSMWWRRGTAVGYDSGPDGWESAGDVTATFGEGMESLLPYKLRIRLSAGETLGIYFQSADSNRGQLVSSGPRGAESIGVTETMSDDSISVRAGASHGSLWSQERTHASGFLGSVLYSNS